MSRTRNMRGRALPIGALALSMTLAACAFPLGAPAPAQAATPQVGKYVVNYYTHKPKPSPNGTTAYRGTQSVKVLAYNAKTKKVKLRFYFCTCHYASDFHSWATWAKVKNGKARFTFRYYYGTDPTPPKKWLGKARATVKFGKGSVKVKYEPLYYAGARFSFDTSGKFMKIKKGTHRKYVD